MDMGKLLVCDSGSLISLTTACITELLYFFKEKYHLSFVMPPAVEEETVLYPLRKRIKEYMFSAIKIKDAINDGVITVMNTDTLARDRDGVMAAANNLFYAQGRPLNLIQKGESEVLALAHEIGADSILLDERTTRMLIEAPFVLKKHMEEEFHVNVMMNKGNLDRFSNYSKGITTFRSSEVVILGYETGYFNRYQGQEKDALEAALYRVRFAGCSIRFDEVSRYLRTL
jgi:hypothetical protein